MKRAYRLPVHVEGELPGNALSKPAQAIVFRVVRELLFNAHKHANASNVWVTLSDADDALTISIRDDGVGFDMSHLPGGFSRHGGYGLFSVSAQIEGIGGGLSIRSSDCFSAMSDAAHSSAWHLRRGHCRLSSPCLRLHRRCL